MGYHGHAAGCVFRAGVDGLDRPRDRDARTVRARGEGRRGVTFLAQPVTSVEAGPAIGLLTILVSAALTENILLTRFLGLCPFLAISRNLKSAFGMGLAVVVVTTCTVWLNSLLYQHVLKPAEAYGVPAESLKLILFIVVIAAFVQLLEMVIERISLKLYFALGIFLPLITV
ncbi:MAG TPA: hypothetical protein DCX07_03135, partial [Phycisphaerales bacterium]|nr:hypothetical protein [Phycisphaerales bacterium]